jgi:penicillin-binding protein 1A
MMLLSVMRGIARIAFVLVVLGVTGAAVGVGYGLYYFSHDLPDFQRIANYVPAVGSKVYDADGKLIAEFETERRIPVSIDEVPTLVVNAFLAAEDRDFYTHKGVNPQAIFRAAVADIARFHSGQRPIGASTITQQVVRHFLLSRELSMTRKVKEAILAYRLDKELSKDRILEVYLNEIYLGAGAYGVAAAADTYFQKKLDQLTPAEAAYLAALPKAPNNYNPIRNAAAAKARRNWVLASMAELGWLKQDEATHAMAEPLRVNMRPEPPRQFGYFVEEVRRGLIGRYGEEAVYEGGLTIRTSYTPARQRIAEKSFRNGLLEYDLRHGWRGPIARLGNAAEARKALADTQDPPGIGEWRLAAVVDTDAAAARIVLRDGSVGEIPISDLRWARPTIRDQRLGAGVRRAADVVQTGDLVLVEPLGGKEGGGKGRKVEAKLFALRQIPDVGGGLVVLDPKTGRILALVGGWSFQQSQFNRSTQAQRQPGSSIKPFVYLTALMHGYTMSSTVEDTPLEVSQGPGLPPWRPGNYDGDYGGIMTLENALVQSRNLATAHIALDIGMKAVAQTVQNFDIMDKMPLYPSMALGAGDTTLLRLTNAYAMLDNGGHWLVPSVIDAVQDRHGRVIYQKGIGGCPSCFALAGTRADGNPSTLYRAIGAPAASAIGVSGAAWAENPVAYEPIKRGPLADPQAIHDIVETLTQVIQRGTGTLVRPILKDLAQPLAGKTGTTSNYFDAWFVGFSPDLVAGTYVGFDEPRTLGDAETGGRVAAGIFRDFMHEALKGAPARDFPEPEANKPEPGKNEPSPAEAVVANQGANQGASQGTKSGETAAEAPVKRRAAPRRDNGPDDTETAKLNRRQLDRDPGDAVEEAAYGPRWRERRRSRASDPANSEPVNPAPAEPPYNPPPRQPDYVAAGPGVPAAWGAAYPQPGGGGGYDGPAMPPRRPAPGPRDEMTPFAPPAPPWGQRPGPAYGTGGLY